MGCQPYSLSVKYEIYILDVQQFKRWDIFQGNLNYPVYIVNYELT